MPIQQNIDPAVGTQNVVNQGSRRVQATFRQHAKFRQELGTQHDLVPK